MVRVKKKSFIVTTLLVPILIAAIFFIVIYVSMSSLSDERVAVIDETGLYSDVLADNEYYTFVPSSEPLEAYTNKAKLEEEGLSAVLYIKDTLMNNPNGWSLYSYKKLPDGIVRYINDAFTERLKEQRIAQYDIEGLPEIIDDVETTISVPTYQWDSKGEESKSSGTLAGVIGMILSAIILAFMSNYSGQVMSGVLEEKNKKPHHGGYRQHRTTHRDDDRKDGRCLPRRTDTGRHLVDLCGDYLYRRLTSRRGWRLPPLGTLAARPRTDERSRWRYEYGLDH